MAVTDDFPAAARCCYADGELLFREQRFANASHLFGLGAECALKTLLRRHSGAAAVSAIHLPALQAQAL